MYRHMSEYYYYTTRPTLFDNVVVDAENYFNQ